MSRNEMKNELLRAAIADARAEWRASRAEAIRKLDAALDRGTPAPKLRHVRIHRVARHKTFITGTFS